VSPGGRLRLAGCGPGHPAGIGSARVPGRDQDAHVSDAPQHRRRAG
jgi:hypothetical protein